MANSKTIDAWYVRRTQSPDDPTGYREEVEPGTGDFREVRDALRALHGSLARAAPADGQCAVIGSTFTSPSLGYVICLSRAQLKSDRGPRPYLELQTLVATAVAAAALRLGAADLFLAADWDQLAKNREAHVSLTPPARKPPPSTEALGNLQKAVFARLTGQAQGRLEWPAGVTPAEVAGVMREALLWLDPKDRVLATFAWGIPPACELPGTISATINSPPVSDACPAPAPGEPTGKLTGWYFERTFDPRTRAAADAVASDGPGRRELADTCRKLLTEFGRNGPRWAVLAFRFPGAKPPGRLCVGICQKTNANEELSPVRLRLVAVDEAAAAQNGWDPVALYWSLDWKKLSAAAESEVSVSPQPDRFRTVPEVLEAFVAKVVSGLRGGVPFELAWPANEPPAAVLAATREAIRQLPVRERVALTFVVAAPSGLALPAAPGFLIRELEAKPPAEKSASTRKQLCAELNRIGWRLSAATGLHDAWRQRLWHLCQDVQSEAELAMRAEGSARRSADGRVRGTVDRLLWEIDRAGLPGEVAAAFRVELKQWEPAFAAAAEPPHPGDEALGEESEPPRWSPLAFWKKPRPG